MTCFVFAYKLFSESDRYQLVINCTRWDLTFMNLQSCTQENTFCGCLKLLSSNYKPTGPQLASVHFHAIYVQFLYFRENWTWIKLVPSTRQNMWQTTKKQEWERERENRYPVSIQFMVLIYCAIFITCCSITPKNTHNSVLNWKHVLKSWFQLKIF